MVSITAQPEAAWEREPMDLILILNIRSGEEVPKNWKKLLIEAVNVVVHMLGDEDRLAILPVQPSLSWMTKEGKNAVPTTVTRDDSPLLNALESAELMLYDRGRMEKDTRMGHIIVISNSDVNVASLDSLLPWRFRSVHAFGFRGAGNARTMHSIAANNRECIYAILDDEYGQITQAFKATIKRITTPITGTAMPIEVKLKCEQHAFLSAINGPLVSYFISSNKKAGIIWANAYAAAGVGRTNFIVYLGYGSTNFTNWSNLFKVDVKYDQVSGKSVVVQKYDQQVSDKSVDVHKYDQVSHKLEGQVVTVRKGDLMSKEVAAEMVRLQAVKVVNNITEKTIDKNEDQEQLHASADTLWQEWTSTRSGSDWGREADEGGLVSALAAEMKEMEIRLYNNYLWKEYMLSWLSHQRWQLPLPPLFMDKQATDERPVQLEIFAKLYDDKHRQGDNRVPVVLRVKVPERGLAKLKTSSVDVIVVVDAGQRSGELESIAEDRLQLVRKAVDVIMDKLRYKDRLAILPVQLSVTQPAPVLLEMSKQGQTQTFANLQSLLRDLASVKTTKPIIASAQEHDTQTPHWREKIKKTVQKVRNCLLGTDDSPLPTRMSLESQRTSSIVHSVPTADSSSKLQNVLMDATKMLDNRPGNEQDRVGFIIVISDSEDDSICKEELSPKYTTHAFGISGMHNARAMYHVASRSNGIYDILNDARNQITEAFKSCIDRVTSTIVVDTKVEIACSGSSSAALSSIECGQFKSALDSAGKSSIWVGPLHATAVKNFLCYIDNVHKDDHGGFFIVDVKCAPAVSTPGEKLDFTRNKIDDLYDEVEASIGCVAAVKIVTEITDPNYHIKLLARLPKEMETMQSIFAKVMEKLENNLKTHIADDPDYNEKLVLRLPWEMCLSAYEYTLAAGKPRHRKDIEKSKPGRGYQLLSEVTFLEESLARKLGERDANLRMEINARNYHENLVARLVRLLSPQGSSTKDASEACLMLACLMMDSIKDASEAPKDANKACLMAARLIMDSAKDGRLMMDSAKDARLMIDSIKDTSMPRLMMDSIKDASEVHFMLARLMMDSTKDASEVRLLTDSSKAYLMMNSIQDAIKKARLMMDKIVLEMENMETYLSRQLITDPTFTEEQVKHLVKKVCDSCAKHAQDLGAVQLGRQMREMNDSLTKEMVVMVRKEMTVPMYYKKLMTYIARLMCLNDFEIEKAQGRRYALMMEKMEGTVAREMEKMEADYYEIQNIDCTYNQKLEVLLVREMFIEVFEKAQVAGETRLSSEMEKMEDSLQYERTDPNYTDYKKLVANKLPYMLSWLSTKGLCEQPPLD
ncbi:hypothetical protein E2562_013179 [Oryza meyeriana var. granulata]|uniref:VWFA domain-containing protein n=1 Tax=Oryza meyeriana var. granulata TaxID=110450 RepID=A0A6G1DIH5_9ORYZ|nr:hypothetical protein E2562_013179 [Oryza meyeriana var. granulata]